MIVANKHTIVANIQVIVANRCAIVVKRRTIVANRHRNRHGRVSNPNINIISILQVEPLPARNLHIVHKKFHLRKTHKVLTQAYNLVTMLV